MIGLLRTLLARAVAELQRRALGVSPDEIRYTFDDVRNEIRATRAELLGEIAALRRDVERLSGGDARDGREPRDPVAEA